MRGDLVIGKGEIFPDVSRGSDAISLIRRGMIGATSIGFRGKEYEGNKKGGYDFKEIELVEVSLVKSPANPKAQITAAKNDDGSINIRNLEKALREAGLSRNEVQLVLSGKARELRDALRVKTLKDTLADKLNSDN